MTYTGTMIRDSVAIAASAVREWKRAYRVTTANGSLVLCDRHLELYRERETIKLTGEIFSPEMCDFCEDEQWEASR